MAGWHWAAPALSKLLPFAPGRYGPYSVGVLGSLGLLCAACGRRRVAFFVGAGITLLATLLLAECWLGKDWGLERWFLTRVALSKGAFPSCVSLLGMVSLFTVGLCSLSLGARGGKYRSFVTAGSGALMLAIGFASIVSVGLEVTAPGHWLRFDGLGPQTSLIYLLTGLGILSLLWAQEGAGRRPLTWWGARSVGIFLMVGSLFLYRGITLDQTRYITQNLQAEWRELAEEVSQRVMGPVTVFQRLARQLERDPKPEYSRWVHIVDVLRVDFPSVRYVLWIDRAFQVHRISSRSLSASGLPLDLDPLESECFSKARRLRKSIVSPLAIRENQKELAAAIPVFGSEGFRGSFLLRMDASALLQPQLESMISRGYRFSLRDNGAGLWEEKPEGPPQWRAAGKFEVGDSTWELELWPSSGMKQPFFPYLAESALVLGTLMAVLYLLLVRQNTRLSTEVARRREAESQLQELNQTLEERVAQELSVSEKRAAALARSERALREQADVLRTVLESMATGVLVFNRQGSLILSNPAAHRIARMENTDTDLVHRADLNEVYSSDRKTRVPPEQLPSFVAIRGGNVDDQEMFVRSRRTGEEFWILVSARSIRDGRGEVTGAVVAFHDITVRKQAEETVQKLAEDLRRSNRDLEQFAYIISHDLQEPLRTISSYVSLLVHRYGSQFDKDGHEFAFYAIDGAKRMQRMIQGLLQYSRAGTGKREREPVQMGVLVEEAKRNLRASLDEVKAIVSMGELPRLGVDRSQLTQVFQNLLGNALKFRRHGESLRIDISARREGTYWVFSVEDNGIGIETAHLDRVFDIFQRLHTRGEYPGEGIGLAMCKKIIQAHGGKIWAEAKPKPGALVRFTLPFPTVERSLAAEARTVSAPASASI